MGRCFQTSCVVGLLTHAFTIGLDIRDVGFRLVELVLFGTHIWQRTRFYSRPHAMNTVRHGRLTPGLGEVHGHV